MPPRKPENPIEEEHYTVTTASVLTDRSEEVIRRYIRNGTIKAVQDPTDKRRLLIPATELVQVIRRPRRGFVKRRVALTLSNGQTLKVLVAQKKAN